MAEKKYIEREAAISRLDELEKTSHHNSVLWPDHVEECREALRSIPAADVVPAGAYNQAAWERDTAIEQLKQIGKSFCERMDDVRPVVVCANCEHNNHCLTQEFVDDCGKIPLDRNTFFCADGERRNNA